MHDLPTYCPAPRGVILIYDDEGDDCMMTKEYNM